MKTFNRKIYRKLEEWKVNYAGKTALLVEGARRVGKSTVVEEFAKKEYDSHVIIDFAFASPQVKALFEDLSDLNHFFRMLQYYAKRTLTPGRSVIVFDEVQLFPLARQAIKLLVKDGRYHYIETGSLISVKENVKGILIPSEERRLAMHPMDYEEFCMAVGEGEAFEAGREMFRSGKSWGEAVNRELMRKFRTYMIVGGMPQAVSAFLETNSYLEADLVKRDILDLYGNDFMKFDPTGRASAMFRAIPSELQKNASRYQVSSVLANERADSMLPVLNKLVDSKTVNIAYHANNPEAGLMQNIDVRKFKLFMADTGLFVTQCFRDKETGGAEVFDKLVTGKLGVNLGYVFENAVAQVFAANGDGLFYHTFRSETSNHNHEVDFLLARGAKVCPVEVKSGGSGRHKSLDAFAAKFSGRILRQYVIHQKELRRDGEALAVPFYMAQFL